MILVLTIPFSFFGSSLQLCSQGVLYFLTCRIQFGEPKFFSSLPLYNVFNLKRKKSNVYQFETGRNQPGKFQKRTAAQGH